MATDFQRTLKPIITVAKLFGFVSTVYVVDPPTGLLVRDTSTIYYSFLEILRTLVLLVCTYKYYDNEFVFKKLFASSKFWIVIVAARLSEVWIIKFINGITEYDKKLLVLPKAWTDRYQQSMSIKHWNTFLAVLFVYYVAFQVYTLYFNPLHHIRYLVLDIMFLPPFVIDFAVIILSCFYLVNLERRFKMLNSVWQCLPAGLVAVPGGRTYTEITVLVDTIRLLHAELCELLRIFSSGFGQVLLGYFVVCYVNMVFQYFLIVSIGRIPLKSDSTRSIFRLSQPYVMNLQHITFFMFIIVAASRIIERKRKIISYLRLSKISKLPVDLKLQVKQFMNQVLVFEPNEITAFGVFKIDLNLAVTKLVLLITGLSTLIQMKEHPILLSLTNDTLIPVYKY